LTACGNCGYPSHLVADRSPDQVGGFGVIHRHGVARVVRVEQHELVVAAGVLKVVVQQLDVQESEVDAAQDDQAAGADLEDLGVRHQRVGQMTARVMPATINAMNSTTPIR
jgi:hypothetical protein